MSPDAYRKLGFRGAEDLGNHFQFKRTSNGTSAGPQPGFARALNPSMQTFETCSPKRGGDPDRDPFPVGVGGVTPQARPAARGMETSPVTREGTGLFITGELCIMSDTTRRSQGKTMRNHSWRAYGVSRTHFAGGGYNTFQRNDERISRVVRGPEPVPAPRRPDSQSVNPEGFAARRRRCCWE